MKKQLKTKLKVDDVVVVIAGKDKGKRGKILSFHPEKNRLVVEGINKVTKSLKKTQENQSSGFNVKEAPIHLSNVMYFDKETNSRSRIGLLRQGKRVVKRIFKAQNKKALVKSVAVKPPEAAQPVAVRPTQGAANKNDQQ